MSEPITRCQFWSGISLTIITTVISVCLGVWQTRTTVESSYKATQEQIAADRRENEQVHASSLLKELSLAIDEVRGQLVSHASMFFEMEACLDKATKNPSACWSRVYAFDPTEAQKAWVSLDASIRAASPFLVTKQEIDLLDRLREQKITHQEHVNPALAPKSVSEAQSIRSTILATAKSLSIAKDQLEKVVSQRARGKQ
jgi:hypothetical protein